MKLRMRCLKFLRCHFAQIVLSIYLGLVWNILVFQFAQKLFDTGLGKLIYSFIIIGVFFVSFLLVSFVINRLKKISCPRKPDFTKKQKVYTFAFASALFFFTSLIWFLAYSPGGLSNDSFTQLLQVESGSYNDWHPVLHTILAFTIPLKLFGSVESIAVCQIAIFSLAMGYMVETIVELLGKKWGLAALCLLLFNPFVFDELMYPWKDVAFAITAVLVATTVARIIFIKNEISYFQICFVAICLGVATFLRHNALLFTIPLILSLWFYFERKAWLVLVAIFSIFVFVVKVPFYSLIGVEAPDKRAEEMVGLPLTVLGNVMKETPSALDEETFDFMSKIAPQEKWVSDYLVGNFNAIKWKDIDLAGVDEVGAGRVLLYSIRAIIRAPRASLDSAFSATQVVYGLENVVGYSVVPEVLDSNPKGIVASGSESLRNVINAYRSLFQNSVLKYFGYIGTTILVMLFFIFGMDHRKGIGWKRFLLCFPIILYDFGTMLFLSGPELRFFYVNYLIYPLVVAIAIVLSARKWSHPDKLGILHR